jgi:formylglycine-generating enzyme required for sulfatase activity
MEKSFYDMVLITGGTFIMGSTDITDVFEGHTLKQAIDRAAGILGYNKDDLDVEILEKQHSGIFSLVKNPVRIKVKVHPKNTHQEIVNSFYMGKHEVTQKEYQKIIKTTPSFFNGENLPVEQVSWYDTIEFCNALSLHEGLVPAYIIDKDCEKDEVQWLVSWNTDANGYRLPTEAEWEYACRAGTTTQFNTGNNITTDHANYNGNYTYNNNPIGVYRKTTTPVGSFEPNAWGLYDKHGNVWEWCWDRKEAAHPSEVQTNPALNISEVYRVLRGGSWKDSCLLLRSTIWVGGFPSGRDSLLGFRLARNVEEKRG